MIQAERQPDQTIDTKVRGDAAQIVIEAGALMARVVELVADATAVANGVSVEEAQLKTVFDIVMLANHRLEAARAQRGDKPN